MRHRMKVISISPVGPTDNHISDKGLGPQLQWCSQDNRGCADTVTDLHPVERRNQLRTDSGARSLEMGGKARDGLTELYLEKTVTRMCSCACQKVIAHQKEDEAVPTTVKMWSCSANHPAPSTKASRKCPHMFTLELSTSEVIPWSCSGRQVPTLLFRRSCVQRREYLPTAQGRSPTVRDYPRRVLPLTQRNWDR